MAAQIIQRESITFMLGEQSVYLDAEDAHILSDHGWYIDSKGYLAKSARADGQNKKIYFHRLVMGADDTVMIDHKDGDTLNNSKSNLRVCTHAENSRNRGKQSNNRSGFKGVYADRDRWRAEIICDGKRQRLGSHKTPELAYAAYCRAADLLHGKFANHG